MKKLYEACGLKISPDSSGYAAEALAIVAGLAAFERIAGRVYLQSSKVSLQKKMSESVNYFYYFDALF